MDFADAFGAVKRFGRPLKPYLRSFAAQSYGQYGEDALFFAVMQPARRGFYVDVGAFDPREGSNTYKLYQRGWRGITIEPNPQAAPTFRLFRPRDTHLVLGASATPATLSYYEFEVGMLNTTDGERADALVAEGYRLTGKRKIPCERLDVILGEHAPDTQIDLLSVDCEGGDLDVLQTLDFEKLRPTVVLMEDLEGYYEMRGGGGHASSPAHKFMRERGYEPVAKMVYTTMFVALDWRELNKRSRAYREEAIHPNLLPEGERSRAHEAASSNR